MKKSNMYSVLSLALISGMLASCGQTQTKLQRGFKNIVPRADIRAAAGEPEVRRDEDGEIILINDPSVDPSIIGVKSISIDRPIAYLFFSNSPYNKFNETVQLNAEYLPLTAKASAFRWSSDHPEIASVDAKTGLVKALSAGIATISVTSEDGFTATSHVVVNDANVSINDVNKSAKKIKDSQKDISIDKIFVSEKYLSQKTIDGVLSEMYSFTEKFWASKENAYFRIVDESKEIKCEGGSVSFSKIDYIFYTNEQYYTYIFANKPNAKNYMVLDQSGLVATHSRYEAMCLVLESFFTNGASIIENQYRDIFGSQDLDPNVFKSAKSYGSFGEDSKQFGYNVVPNPRGGKISIDEEEEWGIPAGTVVTISDDTKHLWENNLQVYKDIKEVITYQVESKPVSEDFNIQYYYEHENVDLVYPNESEYTKVEDIFGL